MSVRSKTKKSKVVKASSKKVKKPEKKKPKPEKKEKEKKPEKPKINLMSHFLVPEHVILKEDEKNALLEKYNILENQLPKILATDPIVKQIEGKVGDVVKITRNSQTAGKSFYFRLVVEKGG